MDKGEFFGKPIYTYTSQQAEEDGILFNITKLNPEWKKGILNYVTTNLLNKGYIEKENIKNNNYGATNRLGNYPCEIKKGTLAFEAYKKKKIEERHRHRWEVNPSYIKKFEKAGLIFSGKSPNRRLMEIAELPKAVHPFMLGSQFHPELTSSPLCPSPLFLKFIENCIKKTQKKT